MADAEVKIGPNFTEQCVHIFQQVVLCQITPNIWQLEHLHAEIGNSSRQMETKTNYNNWYNWSDTVI